MAYNSPWVEVMVPWGNYDVYEVQLIEKRVWITF